MTAEPARKRAPYFTTYTEVEVDVRPEELERAGWVYVGKGEDDTKLVDALSSAEEVTERVRRWHDDTHPGVWQWCQERPCRDLRVVPQG
jgi:hypothetical protein